MKRDDQSELPDFKAENPRYAGKKGSDMVRALLRPKDPKVREVLEKKDGRRRRAHPTVMASMVVAVSQMGDEAAVYSRLVAQDGSDSPKIEASTSANSTNTIDGEGPRAAPKTPKNFTAKLRPGSVGTSEAPASSKK